MVLMMENDFDMEKGKIRVLNEVIRVLDEEIRVSSGPKSDFDEIRVLDEEIRVSSGPKSDFDEIRVLEGGNFVNEDNVEVDGGRILSSRGTVEGGELESRNFELSENGTGEMEASRISEMGEFEKEGNLGSGRKERSSLSCKGDFSGDGEIVEGGKLERRDFEFGGSETGELELSRVSGMDKFREVEKGGNDLGENVVVGSVRKGKLTLSSMGGEDDGEIVVRDGNLKSRNCELRKNEIEKFEISSLSSMGGKGDGDGEIVEGGKLESRDFEFGGSETGELELSRVKKCENDLGENVVLESVRKEKSSLSSMGGVDDGEIVVRGENLKSRNCESRDNEIVEFEMSKISGTGKSREVKKGENDVGRAGKSSLLRKGGFIKAKGIYKGEGSHMDGKVGDFKVERRRNSGLSLGKKILGIDIDGSVMKSVRAKVLGTKFEIGDMVWGKVKSHPWWPGHLHNETFASSSVRRTRGDGHILVAFFGDSSYGWFEPDELVPYDPHYTEKSQQTTSKNFVRALEESVDEASRRSALGLSCYCRNPNNFRPTNVPGYMAVDVSDVERDSIYSVSQIKKARDSFSPSEMLSFIRKLATSPMSSEPKTSLDFIQNNATTLAYRRSVYEEFDPTYAEAFGYKPVRPELPPASELYRAPLSGPLVFADSRSGQKISTKATKPKEQSKKDKYPFKRRDDSRPSKKSKITRVHSSPSSSPHEDGTSVTAKRDQAATNNDLATSRAVDHLPTLGDGMASEDALTADRILMHVPQQSESNEAVTAEAGDVGKVTDRSISIGTPTDAGNLASNGSLFKKKKKAAKHPASELNFDNSEPEEKKLKKTRKAENSRSNSAMSGGVSPVNSSERPVQVVSSVRDDTEVSNLRKDAEASLLKKKKKAVKRPASELNLENSEPKEKNVKKTREAENSRSNSSMPGGVSHVNSTERPLQVVASIRDDTEVSNLKKDAEANNSDSLQVGLDPLAQNWVNKVDVRQTLANLHRIALYRLNGMEMNLPAIGRQFLLKFRSMVFRKACRGSIVDDLDHGVEVEIADKAPTKKSKTLMISSTKDDSIKGDRKRVPSERQEENAAKRIKKITDVKSSADKKSAELSVKSEEQSRKADPPIRVEEPTYLVMKFPSGASLPSLVELKAKFTRFGPMDLSLSRVFYKTNTCRIAFLFKQDANVAYRYAVGSKTMFLNVHFMLKPVPRPESQLPNPAPSLPLKSILKKPSVGDKPGGPSNGGGGPRTARVSFNMGEEKINPAFTSNEGARLSSSSSNIAMDVNNNRRFMSKLPLQPPFFPVPQFVMPPINTRRNNFHENYASVSQVLPPPPPRPLPPPPPPPPSIDIYRDMMGLLTICDQMVNDVKRILGYMPYHEL